MRELCIFVLMVCTPFVCADTTFFDNPGDLFILGDEGQESDEESEEVESVSRGGGSALPDILPSLYQENETGQAIASDDSVDASPNEPPRDVSFLLLLVLFLLLVTGCVVLYRYRKRFFSRATALENKRWLEFSTTPLQSSLG